tara:strand:- start:613 stop:738 length:126 start_codon:yes stop_codon:yes gene_type:complete
MISLSKLRGNYGQRGRPPAGWTPEFNPILIIKKGKFYISFD